MQGDHSYKAGTGSEDPGLHALSIPSFIGNEIGIQSGTNHSISMTDAIPMLYRSCFWLGHGLLLFPLSLEKRPFATFAKDLGRTRPQGLSELPHSILSPSQL